MIRVNDTVYPIANIKLIKIDWDNNSLIYYFIDNLRLPPIAIKYNSVDELIKRVRELTNEPEPKSKRLFG